MNKEYSCNKCGSVIYTKNKPNSECNCGGNWEEIKEIIVVENNQLENLCNEYPANEKRLKKLIKEKIDYYSKNPFNSKFKEITLENIKEKITLTNTLYKETTKEEENKEEFHNSFIWDENKVIQKRVFPIDQHKDFFYFGVQIPKMVDVKDKGGKITGRQQEFRPCIINSKGELIQITNRTKEDFELYFENIPYSLPRRWKLEHMKKFLDGNLMEVNGQVLLNKIKDQYEKYMFIRNKTWFKLFALWDIGTYLYPLFEAYPFIENRGIAGTGKTKSMVISSFISFNGGQIMVNPSEATLFRETEEVRGTKYIDEAEKLFVINKKTHQVENDPRVELINSSYTKSGPVPRQEKIGNKFVTKWYSTYSPTQLSSINGLYGATETRAITRITTKSPNDDPRGETDPSEDRKNPIWEEIRDECYRFALENWEQIRNEYLNFPKDCGLKNRELQIWKPILAIAKYISKEFAKYISKEFCDEDDYYNEILNFAKEISERRLDDLIQESSFDYMCLEALRDVIVENETNKIYIETIKRKYCKNRNDMSGLDNIYLNRNISNHLDKLGFKELRNRGKKGSYFELDYCTFNEIVHPICPNLAILSTSSTPSTPLCINNKNNSVDKVMMGDDDISKRVTMMTIGDENVDTYDKKGKEKDEENPHKLCIKEEKIK